MEFGVLIGVSTPWNGNSKSQGPEGLGSVCWGCCYQDRASCLPEVPAFPSSSSGSTDHRHQPWLFLEPGSPELISLQRLF